MAAFHFRSCLEERQLLSTRKHYYKASGGSLYGPFLVPYKNVPHYKLMHMKYYKRGP